MIKLLLLLYQRKGFDENLLIVILATICLYHVAQIRVLSLNLQKDFILKSTVSQSVSPLSTGPKGDARQLPPSLLLL